MDFSRFRFVVVVDWVELEVRTLKPTQPKYLYMNGAGRFSHAHSINPQTGEKYPDSYKNTTSTRFAVRIQAPERFTAITEALDTIRERLAPSCTIAVRGIEVALDAYANDGSGPEDLAEMTSHFLKGINRVSPNHPRSYREKGETRAIGSRRELIQALQDGFQIGIGDGNGNRYQHGYLKAQDSGEALPIGEHRARIEIRLQGDGCPVVTLDDLSSFNFSSLSDYFQFRQSGEPQSDLERLMAERQICLGNIIADDGDLQPINRKEGGTRRNKRGTKASPLNGIARVRLRSLTKRWLASAGRGKMKKSDAITCGNSDRLGSVGAPNNQPESIVRQQRETPYQCWGTPCPEIASEHPTNSTSKNPSLNTSYPPDTLSNPIKVVCGIVPVTDLQLLINDLNQSTYPTLPDLTRNLAEV